MSHLQVIAEYPLIAAVIIAFIFLGWGVRRLLSGRSDTCVHDLVFFDSCPHIEIFECTKCKIKKFVSDDGHVEWKDGEI